MAKNRNRVPAHANGTRSPSAYRTPEPFPTRHALVRAEQLLTRFRFECEECGWWPEAVGVPGLCEFTGAVGLAWELRRWHRELVEACRRRHDSKPIVGRAADDPNEYIVPFSNEVCARFWPKFWAVEIELICRALGILVSQVLRQWEPHVRGCGHVSLAEFESPEGSLADDGADEENARFVSGTHRFYLTPKVRANGDFALSTEIAASIARCTARLRAVLAAGPLEAFVPTEREGLVLAALDGRAMTMDALAEHLDVDRSKLCQTEVKHLMNLGLIANDQKVGGYYRPDRPPHRA